MLVTAGVSTFHALLRNLMFKFMKRLEESRNSIMGALAEMFIYELTFNIFVLYLSWAIYGPESEIKFSINTKSNIEHAERRLQQKV